MAEIRSLDTKKVGLPVETAARNQPPAVSSIPTYVAPTEPAHEPAHEPPHEPPHENPQPGPEPEPHHPDWRTINIHIQINFPATWRFPRCRRRKSAETTERRRSRGPLRFLRFCFIIFYTSFLVCSATCWGLRAHTYLRIQLPVLIINTFTTIFDALAVGSLIHLLRRNPDNAKPGFRWVAVILLNEILLVFHIVVMIFAATWASPAAGNRYWYNHGKHKAIAGMTLYTTITMIVFKLLFLVHILRWPDVRKTIRDSFTRLVDDDCDYTKVSSYDPDARNIRASIKNPRDSEEGRIFLS